MQFDQLKRREFITLLGGAAAAWPLAARAQQPSTQVARIGVLNTGIDDAVSGGLGYRAFVAELQKLGLTEGRNLVIDYGRTDQGADKAFADAATMGRSNVAVIVASGSELPLQAAVAASPSVPIVILANNYDPIARGYVTSLARPGGRITGLFNRQPELAQKRVELLTEAFPTRTRLAVLWDASSSEAFAAAEGTAKALSLQFSSTKLQRPPYDFDATFHSMIKGVYSLNRVGRKVRFRGQTGKRYARSEPCRFLPQRSFGSFRSTCLPALVTHRPIEAWYHPSIA